MPLEPADKNRLFYGDNLEVLRQYVDDESVDLVYLDPPFKSDQDFNVLFKEHDGTRAAAQIKAFEDTWRWDEAAEHAYRETVEAGGRLSQAMQALRAFLGASDMMAYLSMMAPRLQELRRVLKPTGSLYLHCDPTASHYLRILLDAVFDPTNVLSEVVWKRTGTHSSANRWGPVHDVLLVYARERGRHTWNRIYVPLSDAHQKRHYRQADADGRTYTHGELTAPGVRHGRSGATWRGFDVTAIGRHWCTTVDKLDVMAAEGRIYFPGDGAWPRLVRYHDESKGRALGDVWEDIPPLNMKARERLGYPTQKPEALLERIVAASSGAGDVVLDAFCGCGTTIAAAQGLGRRWIGVDITHLAINLIKHRLRSSCGLGIEATFTVTGEPVSEHDARELARTDPFQFQCWALGLVWARPAEVRRGADRGIDGRLFFHDEPQGGDTKVAVFSVKGGKLKATDVRDLRAVLERERAAISALISIEEPTRAMRAEAVSAGVYTSPWNGTAYPRLQLLTVKRLLENRRVFEFPADRQINVTFRKAPAARRRGEEQQDLFNAVHTSKMAKAKLPIKQRPRKKRRA